MRAAPRDRLDLLFLAVGAVGVLKNTGLCRGFVWRFGARSSRHGVPLLLEQFIQAFIRRAWQVCCRCVLQQKQAACVARRGAVFGVLSRATRAMSLHARAHAGL